MEKFLRLHFSLPLNCYNYLPIHILFPLTLYVFRHNRYLLPTIPHLPQHYFMQLISEQTFNIDIFTGENSILLENAKCFNHVQIAMCVEILLVFKKDAGIRTQDDHTKPGH